jgi:hypothetical protein
MHHSRWRCGLPPFTAVWVGDRYGAIRSGGVQCVGEGIGRDEMVEGGLRGRVWCGGRYAVLRALGYLDSAECDVGWVCRGVDSWAIALGMEAACPRYGWRGAWACFGGKMRGIGPCWVRAVRW